MKSTRCIRGVWLCALVFVTGCCKDLGIVSVLPDHVRAQETNNWCWAGTTQMLAEHFGIALTQCSLANHRFGKTNCCTPQTAGIPCPKTDDCNSPGWLELDFAGLKFSESGTALSWTKLRKQIRCKKKPMGYAYGTPGVVGHVVVVKGYLDLLGNKWVIINDPWAPCHGEVRLITYAEYADPSGTSTHWDTWFDLDKK
jgi:hypothetical protein